MKALTITLFATAWLLLGCRDSGPPDLRNRDVVILSIETLRADFIRAYGGAWEVSPGLDAIAKKGIRVEQAYAVAPWTRANLGSLLTGVLPVRHGAKYNDAKTGLSPDRPLLAQVFKAAGYATLAVVTNSNVSRSFGFHAGFDEFYPDAGSADRLNARVIASLEKRKGDEKRPPMFVFVHYIEPHHAFFSSSFAKGEGVPGFAPNLGDGERLASIVTYLQYIAFVDHEVAKLTKKLEPLLRDPIVIITSDHGEEWYDHGSLFHGRTLYQEVLRVPLIWSIPGAGSRVVSGPVRSIDVMPTLCELTQVKCPDDLDGQSVAAGLLGTGPFPTEVYAETEFNEHQQALVSGQHKLIRSRKTDRVELYDLAADPRERVNLAPDQPRTVARLQKRMDQIGADLEANRPSPAPPPTVSQQQELSKSLASLGYLGSSDEGSGGPAEASRWPGIASEFKMHDLVRNELIPVGRAPKGVQVERRYELDVKGRETYLVLVGRRHRTRVEILVDGKPWGNIGADAFIRPQVVVPLLLPEGARKIQVIAFSGPLEIRFALVRNGGSLPTEVRGLAGWLRIGDAEVTSDKAVPLTLTALEGGGHRVQVPAKPAKLRARLGPDLDVVAAPASGFSVTAESDGDVDFARLGSGTLPKYAIISSALDRRTLVEGSEVAAVDVTPSNPGKARTELVSLSGAGMDAAVATQIARTSFVPAATGKIQTPASWKVSGPVPAAQRESIGASAVDSAGLTQAALAERLGSLDGVRTTETVLKVNGMEPSVLDLVGLLGAHDASCAYATTTIPSKKARPAQLLIGSDDSGRAWLNGKLVWEFTGTRAAYPDEDRANVALAAGTNELILEVCNASSGWQSYLRVLEIEE